MRVSVRAPTVGVSPPRTDARGRGIAGQRPAIRHDVALALLRPSVRRARPESRRAQQQDPPCPAAGVPGPVRLGARFTVRNPPRLSHLAVLVGELVAVKGGNLLSVGVPVKIAA